MVREFIAKHLHLLGNRYYKPFDVVCDTVVDEVYMIINFNGGIGEQIFYKGVYHYNLTQFFQNIVKPGWICIDGGANIGWFTCLLARSVGKNGRVFGFECNPFVFKSLKKNVGLNCFDNVCCYPLALGKKKEIKKFICYEHEGHGHFDDGRNNVGNIKDVITVDVESLDNLFKKKYFDRVDLIKLDVEGFEFDILLGAIDILKHFHPIIVFEYNNQKDSLGFLSDLNYNLFLLDDMGNIVDLENSMNHLKNNSNVVAINNKSINSSLKKIIS